MNNAKIYSDTTEKPLYKLKIQVDDLPPNPRTDYDNFGHMACWHRRYDLGDKHDFDEPSELLKELAADTLSADEVIDFVKKGGCNTVKLEYNRSGKEWELSDYDSHFKKWYISDTFPAGTIKGSDMVKDRILDCLPLDALKELADRKNVILPLYLYDHSGITISCSHSYPYNDRWDSGQVGWTYVSHDEVKKAYAAVNAVTLEVSQKRLIGETDTYDSYLRGDCYGYTIEKNGEEIDSCWGFLGDLQSMIADMRSGAAEEFQHLFDHVGYNCMEYSEPIGRSAKDQAKPSIRQQLTALKEQKKAAPSKPKAIQHNQPELE